MNIFFIYKRKEEKIMIIIKFIILSGIFCLSTACGITISRKYITREKELKEMLNALNIFEEKIKFTYEPIPDVFKEISEKCISSIGNIFKSASDNMQIMSAGEAWEKAIDESETKLNKGDKDTIKGLAKMLGQMDLDGQVNEIRLTMKFLENKIEDAQMERKKNEKLYKTLGATIGLAIVIILV
jgi:stage III sporulation protein AB